MNFFSSAYSTLVTKTMGQYTAVVLILIAFSHISTIGWIIFKYPTDLEKFGESKYGGVTWYQGKFRYYFHHLYFVMTTCSTIGYGDVTPDKDSPSELIFGMLVELVGLSILGIMWLMSNILLSNFTKQKARVMQNMKDFNNWFKTIERSARAEFSTKFVNELSRFFNLLYRLEIDTAVYDNEYLELMAPKDASKLETCFLQAHKSPFAELFKLFDKEMCIDIIRGCEQTSYVAGTTILHRGHNCPGVFWISKGKVECRYLKPEQVITEIGEGDWFGSFCILDEPVRCDYVAKDICMVHFLPKELLNTILDTFKLDSLRFRMEATDDFNELQVQRNSLKSMLKLEELIKNQKMMPHLEKTLSLKEEEIFDVSKLPLALGRGAGGADRNKRGRRGAIDFNPFEQCKGL